MDDDGILPENIVEICEERLKTGKTLPKVTHCYKNLKNLKFNFKNEYNIHSN